MLAMAAYLHLSRLAYELHLYPKEASILLLMGSIGLALASIPPLMRTAKGEATARQFAVIVAAGSFPMGVKIHSH